MKYFKKEKVLKFGRKKVVDILKESRTGIIRCEVLRDEAYIIVVYYDDLDYFFMRILPAELVVPNISPKPILKTQYRVTLFPTPWDQSLYFSLDELPHTIATLSLLFTISDYNYYYDTIKKIVLVPPKKEKLELDGKFKFFETYFLGVKFNGYLIES